MQFSPETWMMFDQEEDNDYILTSGDVDENSNGPGMLELALEYFQKEDPESTGMAYMQSRKEDEPWAVVMSSDPAAMIRLLMELVQQHCPDVSVAMIDAEDDCDFDLEDLLGDD